jgi:hypothetical protein
MATYSTISLDDTAKVDFSQVNQSSAQTMRRNLANTEGLLSYSVTPSYVTSGVLVPLQTMTHAEVLILMQTPEWSEPMPEE